MDGKDVERDLFGVPVTVRLRGRGRPAHEWSEEKSNRVKMMLALGWGVERIAGVLGISVPTLRKHYLAELKIRDIARDALIVRQAEKLQELSEAGNVGAIKTLGALLEKNDRALLAAAARREGAGEAGPERRRQKAEAAERNASRGIKELALERAKAAVQGDPFLDPMGAVRPRPN